MNERKKKQTNGRKNEPTIDGVRTASNGAGKQATGQASDIKVVVVVVVVVGA